MNRTGLRTGRSGVALLEALVALTLLAITGIALLEAVVESASVADRARRTELLTVEAERLMEAATLWSADELDQRLGTRAQGPFRMRIDRPLRTLYLVSIVDSTTSAELVRTSLHRPGIR